MKRSGTIVLATLLALGSLTPLAAADGPIPASLTVTSERAGPDDGIVEPGTVAHVAKLTVELQTQGPLAEDLSVDLDDAVEDHHPGDWRPIVQPSHLRFEAAPSPQPGSGATHTYERQAVLAVQPTPHVPAFVSTPIHVQPEAESVELYDVEASGTQVVATADWVPALDVEPDESQIRAPAGDETHVRANVQNLGNGPAKVTYEALERPPGCSVEPTREDLQLEQHESFDAIFHLVCDSDAQDGDLEIQFDHRYAPDESLEPGEPVTVSWTVDVQDDASIQSAGLTGSSPAWGAAAVLLGAIGVAFRRWRG